MVTRTNKEFHVKQFEYILKGKKQLAPTVCQLLLQPLEEILPYEAGQYCQIMFPDGEPRPYSMANRPRENGVLEFHVRQGLFEVDVFLKHLQEETTILLSEAEGQGTLSHHDYTHPLLLLAGGTGFAPYKALLEQAEVDCVTYPIHLFWGVDREVDWYLPEFLAEVSSRLPQFQYSLLHTLEDPKHPKYLPQLVLESYDDLSELTIYVSGPWEMIKNVEANFEPKGCFYSDMLAPDRL